MSPLSVFPGTGLDPSCSSFAASTTPFHIPSCAMEPWGFEGWEKETYIHEVALRSFNNDSTPSDAYRGACTGTRAHRGSRGARDTC